MFSDSTKGAFRSMLLFESAALAGDVYLPGMKEMVQADGSRIQAARKRQSLTQEKCAQKLSNEVGHEISTRKLQEIEATGRVSRETLETLAALLDVTVESLFSEAQLPWSIPALEWHPDTTSPAWLLRAEFGIVPFHHRENEMNAFREWCSSPAPLRVRLITGSGGMGKTRFAMELCKIMQSEYQWRAGFLRYDSFSEDLNQWKEVFEEHPLLLVLDYAESRVEIIDWLLGAAQGGRLRRLRVILLARTRVGDWWGELCRSRNAGAMVGSRGLDIHELQPVALDRELRMESYKLAFDAFAKRLNLKTAMELPRNIQSQAFERVLLLHIRAFSNLYEQMSDDENGILDYLLHREKRFWSERLESLGMETSLLAAMEEGMAVVSATGGMKTEQAGLLALDMLPSLEGRSRDTRIAINRLLHECYPGSNWIEPIQPDLVAERLTQTVFSSNSGLRKRLTAAVRDAAKKSRTA